MAYSLSEKIAKKAASLGAPNATVIDNKLVINGKAAGDISGFVTEAKLRAMIDAYNAENPNG